MAYETSYRQPLRGRISAFAGVGYYDLRTCLAMVTGTGALGVSLIRATLAI